MREYVVQPGDTLWHVASKTLGPHGDWRVLATLNEIADPKQLRVGQRLKLPIAIAAGSAPPLAPAGSPPPVPPAGSEPSPATPVLPTSDYVVQPGETLRTIANKVLSPGSDWRILATLNGLADPRQVRAGQRLRIPQRVGSRMGEVPATVLPAPTPGTSTASPEANPTVSPAHSTYVVQPGETLTTIASKVLGPGGDWRAIAQLNNITDPKQVRAGQRLRIPTRG